MVGKFQEDGLYLFTDDLNVYKGISSDVIGRYFKFFFLSVWVFFYVFYTKGSC